MSIKSKQRRYLDGNRQLAARVSLTRTSRERYRVEQDREMLWRAAFTSTAAGIIGLRNELVSVRAGVAARLTVEERTGTDRLDSLAELLAYIDPTASSEMILILESEGRGLEEIASRLGPSQATKLISEMSYCGLSLVEGDRVFATPWGRRVLTWIASVKSVAGAGIEP